MLAGTAAGLETKILERSGTGDEASFGWTHWPDIGSN
jgi:hypothetical protein